MAGIDLTQKAASSNLHFLRIMESNGDGIKKRAPRTKKPMMDLFKQHLEQKASKAAAATPPAATPPAAVNPYARKGKGKAAQQPLPRSTATSSVGGSVSAHVRGGAMPSSAASAAAAVAGSGRAISAPAAVGVAATGGQTFAQQFAWLKDSEHYTAPVQQSRKPGPTNVPSHCILVNVR